LAVGILNRVIVRKIESKFCPSPAFFEWGNFFWLAKNFGHSYNVATSEDRRGAILGFRGIPLFAIGKKEKIND
jgi:hypothetical protein